MMIQFLFTLLSVVAALKDPLSKKPTFKLASSIMNWPGKLAPVGYFDPLGFSNVASDDTLKKWREAELKHGRVCMLVW